MSGDDGGLAPAGLIEGLSGGGACMDAASPSSAAQMGLLGGAAEAAVVVPAGWVRTGDLARRWKVSNQTIDNYARGKGCGGVPAMPVAAKDGIGRWFDLAACQRWKSAHRPGNFGRGGKRHGAGARRKRRGGGGGEAPLAAEMGRLGDRESGGVGGSGGGGGGGSIAPSPEAAPVSVRRIEDLDPVQRVKYELDLAKKRDLDFAHEKERGEWLKAAEIRGVVRESVEGMARIAERMPPALAREMVSACGLDPASVGIVERLCGGYVARMLEELQRMGEGLESGGEEGEE